MGYKVYCKTCAGNMGCFRHISGRCSTETTITETRSSPDVCGPYQVVCSLLKYLRFLLTSLAYPISHLNRTSPGVKALPEGWWGQSNEFLGAWARMPGCERCFDKPEAHPSEPQQRHICMYVYIYTYIYICLSLSLYIYIYISSKGPKYIYGGYFP